MGVHRRGQDVQNVMEMPWKPSPEGWSIWSWKQDIGAETICLLCWLAEHQWEISIIVSVVFQAKVENQLRIYDFWYFLKCIETLLIDYYRTSHRPFMDISSCTDSVLTKVMCPSLFILKPFAVSVYNHGYLQMNVHLFRVIWMNCSCQKCLILASRRSQL